MTTAPPERKTGPAGGGSVRVARFQVGGVEQIAGLDIAQGTQHLAAQIRNPLRQFVDEPAEVGAVAVGKLRLVTAFSGLRQFTFFAAADDQRLRRKHERPDDPDSLLRLRRDIRPHRAQGVILVRRSLSCDIAVLVYILNLFFPRRYFLRFIILQFYMPFCHFFHKNLLIHHFITTSILVRFSNSRIKINVYYIDGLKYKW